MSRSWWKSVQPSRRYASHDLGRFQYRIVSMPSASTVARRCDLEKSRWKMHASNAWHRFRNCGRNSMNKSVVRANCKTIFLPFRRPLLRLFRRSEFDNCFETFISISQTWIEILINFLRIARRHLRYFDLTEFYNCLETLISIQARILIDELILLPNCLSPVFAHSFRLFRILIVVSRLSFSLSDTDSCNLCVRWQFFDWSTRVGRATNFSSRTRLDARSAKILRVPRPALLARKFTAATHTVRESFAGTTTPTILSLDNLCYAVARVERIRSDRSVICFPLDAWHTCTCIVASVNSVSLFRLFSARLLHIYLNYRTNSGAVLSAIVWRRGRGAIN